MKHIGARTNKEDSAESSTDDEEEAPSQEEG